MFKNLFKKKETPVESPVDVPELYNLGWQIKLKNGMTTTREWQRVTKEEVDEIQKFISDEVKEMHAALEEASKKKKHFVNLKDNVYRLEDVCSISSHNYKI